MIKATIYYDGTTANIEVVDQITQLILVSGIYDTSNEEQNENYQDVLEDHVGGRPNDRK